MSVQKIGYLVNFLRLWNEPISLCYVVPLGMHLRSLPYLTSIQQ